MKNGFSLHLRQIQPTTDQMSLNSTKALLTLTAHHFDFAVIQQTLADGIQSNSKRIFLENLEELDGQFSSTVETSGLFLRRKKSQLYQ